MENTILIRELHDTGNLLTEERILHFERDLRYDLPHAYRRFLLLRNGGYFYRRIQCPMEDTRWDQAVGGFYFLHLDDSLQGDFNELRFRNDFLWHPRALMPYPQHMLVIADVSGGELLLDLHVGRVHVSVRDYQWQPPEDNAFLVASSFEIFAQRLRYDPDQYYSAKRPPFTFIEHFDQAQLDSFLANGGYPDARDEDGTPALIFALAKGNLDAMRLLLSAGADINLPDGYGHSALHAAALGHSRDAMDLLLQYHPSPLCQDGSGQRIIDRPRRGDPFDAAIRQRLEKAEQSHS